MEWEGVETLAADWWGSPIMPRRSQIRERRGVTNGQRGPGTHRRTKLAPMDATRSQRFHAVSEKRHATRQCRMGEAIPELGR